MVLLWGRAHLLNLGESNRFSLGPNLRDIVCWSDLVYGLYYLKTKLVWTSWGFGRNTKASAAGMTSGHFQALNAYELRLMFLSFLLLETRPCISCSSVQIVSWAIFDVARAWPICLQLPGPIDWTLWLDSSQSLPCPSGKQYVSFGQRWAWSIGQFVSSCWRRIRSGCHQGQGRDVLSNSPIFRLKQSGNQSVGPLCESRGYGVSLRTEIGTTARDVLRLLLPALFIFDNFPFICLVVNIAGR